MLTRIIQFSVKNKLVIALLMVVWVAYGLYQVTRLPIDAVPDITNNQVQIITTAPALGAQDVERLITFPIEQAVSNIPGLKESRSLSRFGLSLITVVFDDDADIYWARQQVTERLQQAELPEEVKTPELSPVTTGLGEIYQYVLKPRKGYENRYSLSDLRTVQDWIVRRQLLGTPGVADVATFGGALKQYEVAVNPARLSSFHLTITEVFDALAANNQNTGGAYIEKGPTVLYIRSEGLAGSTTDLETIVVKSEPDGTPVLLRDVASVREGTAIRYGALTYNDQGEVAGGIVMMLKGANSSEVIHRVKDRITAIQQTLPEGLVIEAFLDRTKMVNNAIGTVKNNLLEGALIVVLVLVLFLGNFRAGLIVASVIPLSMLFAIAMMNTFGVSGNLMSLGALDFGLIVDGAVIIVEAILHHLHTAPGYRQSTRLSQAQMDLEVTGAASRMMNAAVFGQIIILIVYLPVLSLQGIEGKMFRPMAQTVAFAIIGAFILSVTYVPMISALFISRKTTTQANLSDRVMKRFENGYQRWLTKALRFRRPLIAAAAVLLLIALLLFSRMGGEFIPQLEEGDFAVETRLLVGTNLSTTVHTIRQVSGLLKARYPEVRKVVARIGSSEIPTDPMPIEGGDMIVVLKDKHEWTSAASFPELAAKMSATVEEAIPGITLGFQYPVQMRFNELMTGAKQDVVCKLFGEDLDTLAAYAEKIGTISRTVRGTADWYVEKSTGMPQIVIRYNRSAIARYGLNIAAINRTIQAAFAGAAAGQVYEGEKRFDLVVRVGEEGRKDMASVQNLLIATPAGMQIPLAQVAAVEEIEGPNLIQREDAKRRILVGFNVRGRDVQSIVEELQQKIGSAIRLPPGYSITYGGTFENLQQAKQRLTIALPVALILIFAMLYFAFSSLKEGLLIYTAIPLAAIGGVLALALRGMPFSISAGIGFIALFGVAVLNGIVLISEFNRIKKENGALAGLDIVLQGTRNRLRPVLMTAAVASLGFLPMALSNGAGAEVQRPLATVVIGGLITATLLTLFILPALYLLFENKRPGKSIPAVAAVLAGLLLVSDARAQVSRPVSLNEAVQVSVRNNLQIRNARLSEQVDALRQRTALDLPKTLVSADYGQFNSINNDSRFGISQAFSFPTVYSNQRKAYNEAYLATTAETRVTELELKATVRSGYYTLIGLQEKKKLLQYADSIYRLFEEKSNLRFQAGESNVLEQTTARMHRQQIANQLVMLDRDVEITTRQFNVLLQDSVSYQPATDTLRIPFDPDRLQEPAAIEQLPQVQSYQHLAAAAHWRWKTEQARRLPDFLLGFNNQSISGSQVIDGQEVYFKGSRRFNYINAGVGISLFAGAQKARIAAARVEWQLSQTRTSYATLQLEAAIRTALQQVRKYAESLRYYEQQGLVNAAIILRTADQQFAGGDINYLQWVMLADQAIAVRGEYLDMLNSYNQSVIQAQKLLNL